MSAYDDASSGGNVISVPGGGGGSNPSGVGVCKDGNGYLGSTLLFTVYARCRGNTWVTPWVAAYCPTGWEVWRFWGTQSKGIVGRSLSRTTLTDDDLYECSRNVRTLFFASHPDDAAGPQAQAGDAPPWRWWVPRDPRGLQPSFTRQPAAIAGQWGNVFYTTGAPVASWGRPCNAVTDAQGDPLARDLARGGPAADSIQESLTAAYRRFKAAFGHELALAYTNLKSVDPFVYDDQVPCSSEFDFAVDVAGDVPRFGFCAVPLFHTAQPYSGGVVSYRVREMERYERITDVNRSMTRPSWDRTTAFTRDQKRFIYETVLARETRNRNSHAAASLWVLTGAPASSPAPWASRAGVYLAARNQHGTPAQVAASAQRAALCADYSGDQVRSGQQEVTPVAPDGVTFTVTSPPVGQVGGSARVFDIAVSHTPLLCGGVPCVARHGDQAPELVSVSWALDVDGRSFTRCQTRNQFNCDYYVESISPTNARVWFYRASPQAGGLSIALTDVDVRYRERTRVQSRFCFTPPPVSDRSGGGSGGEASSSLPAGTELVVDGDRLCLVSDEIRLGEVEQLPGDRITVVGAPRVVPVIGGVSQPR